MPCENSVCREHLSERDVVKQNKIKCKECKGEFQVKETETNTTLKKLIESQSYLSEKEINLKRDLEVSVRRFVQNKSKLESDVFDHYQEMRFQIDEHRERLKVRIDDSALAMIDKIKKYEEIYLKNLNENFPSFDDSVSLEIKLNEIEELFRNPNLLIESIKEMQQRQDESLNDIQFKLNELINIKKIR